MSDLREAVLAYLDAEDAPAYSWVLESQEARAENRPNREVERMDRITVARAALRAALAATPTAPPAGLDEALRKAEAALPGPWAWRPSAREWLDHAQHGLQSLSDLYHGGGAKGDGITVKEFRHGIDFVWEQINAARAALPALATPAADDDTDLMAGDPFVAGEIQWATPAEPGFAAVNAADQAHLDEQDRMADELPVAPPEPALRAAWTAHFNALHNEPPSLACLDAILRLAESPRKDR